VLPDGRRSELKRIEIDAGWNKSPSYDIAVCTLTDALGAKGHAAWDPFNEALFGSVMHLSGYDSDLAIKGGGALTPQLVDRQAEVERCDQKMKKLGAPAALLSGAFMVYAAGEDIPLLYGGAALFGGYQLLKSAVLDADGWQSSFVTEAGASGGPLWIGNDYPVVIGVQSSFTVLKSEIRNSGLGQDWEPTGGSVGAVIAKGPGFRMIRDHIGGHYRPSQEDDLRIVFMAYPPGTMHDGHKSRSGHAFVGFKKNGEFVAVKGFEPDAILPDGTASRLMDSRKYIGLETTSYEAKVDSATFEKAMAVTKVGYVGIINDCVTYTATIADVINLNRPGPSNVIFLPITYVDTLRQLNPRLIPFTPVK